MTDACAAIVARDDPHLYQSALFAREPARQRLMVLYAFDCELSRATRASTESLIPRMRLQWWRDVVEGAASGEPAKAHEVAGPLATLLNERPLRGSPVLAGLLSAHEAFLDAASDPAAWTEWRQFRHQALIEAAAMVAAGEDVAVPSLGTAWADAFALRHAARMAAEGRTLVEGLEGPDLGALSRGRATEGAAAVLVATARSGLDVLEAARRHGADARTVPALLPTLWAERTLRLVAHGPSAVIGQLDDVDRPFDGFRLAWRALRGRW